MGTGRILRRNKTQRARRGSVNVDIVSVDLQALKKEEAAKKGGERKQNSPVVTRRRRRASVSME